MKNIVVPSGTMDQLRPSPNSVVYMVMASRQRQGSRFDGADEIETEAENAFLNVIAGEAHTESGDFDEFDCIVEALPEARKEESHQNNTIIITGQSCVSTARVDETDARTVGEPSNLTAELVNDENVNHLRYAYAKTNISIEFGVLISLATILGF